jgi:DNA-directed DNA polymerase III PolC
MPPFVSLANHSYYSLLDSTLSPAAIVQMAVAYGMPAVALTDTDTLGGAVVFYKAAKAAGIHPVLGAQVTLWNQTRLTLLVENAEGYRNLCRLLSTRARTHTRFQDTVGLSLDDLARHARGLICLAGVHSDPNCDRYREIYGRNLAFALSFHNEEDRKRSRVLLNAARRLRVPTVIANDVHYALARARDPEESLCWEILSSMRTLTMMGQEHSGKLPPGDYHFPALAEIQAEAGELRQAIENTWAVAERCRFDFELGDICFPNYPGDRPAAEELRALAETGLRWRYGATPSPEARQRLERELHVIEEVGYAEYFLIFADIVRWANQRGIATLARGSAAGSLVCYVLGIGNVCPFRFDLCFERFLNKERMSFQKLADIDLDLPWDQREEVVRYVFEKYGEEHVAMIGAFNTFQGRAAIADIAKVYGIPEREIRRFTEKIPHFSGNAVQAVLTNPECAHLPVRQEPYASILRMAGHFEGIPRHMTMHPCGLVISRDPVQDRMPLFRSAKNLLTTHYAMDDVEELGLLKMDLLGQAGLSVLRETRANIVANRGHAPEAIDESDAATWDGIAKGESRGVFHIESPNMVNLLVLTDCRDINCLTAIESVIRPGAANEGRKQMFARRHQGLEPVTYAHPSLEPLLRETYGLLVYEEHILLVANGFAGMNWGRADTLRRLLVKNRDHARIDALGDEFRECAQRRGHSDGEIETVWGMLREFAGYMFNKAHSAAYAVEAYEGAFLKMRYPVEFLASVLTCRRGFYSPMVYVLEALRNGAKFVGPSVNASDAEKFLVAGDTIRLPLNQVKGISEDTIQRIAAGRPFADVGDFYRRAQPKQSEWLSLLKVGALDGWNEGRGRLFWRLSRLSARGATPGETLFTPEDPDFSGNGVNLAWEAELLGFPVSAHPLDYFAPGLDWTRYVSAKSLREQPQRYFGKTLQVAGMIVAERIHPTPRGPMKFLTIADPTGFLELSLFAEAYAAYGHLTARPVVIVTATGEPYDNLRGVQLNGVRVNAVEAARQERAAAVGAR